MNRFRNFMIGRYGFDQFTRALVILSLLLSVITTFFRINGLVILAYIPLFYALYRAFSRDIQKRSKENMAFMKYTTNIKNRLNHLKLWLVGTKTHKYFTCSKCKQTIRIPRGKGKIAITCPKCKAEFVRRT
ncbi:MAG: hypothetical protein K0R34_1923 [Herbinix sp.]|jgi:hypothetical protein|nr:hypothetical protein [Herbinix sp.]